MSVKDEIYVIDTDGSNQQRLTNGPAVDGDAS
jgi:Tol biopolymer transport system component